MEENKKSSILQKIITCVVVGLLIFSLIQIVNLNDRIDNLISANSRLNSEISQLGSNINSIYSNVDEQLKKEASLISGMDYSVGTPNADMKTVPVMITVVPKTVTNDIKLSVEIDGTITTLERKGNEFSGTIDVGLFEDYGQYPLLTIESSKDIKTEYLEDMNIGNMFDDYLPRLNPRISSSSQVGSTSLHIDGNIDLNIVSADKNPSANFTSITLVEKLNGEEVGREDITDKVLEADMYYKAKYVKTLEIENYNEYDFRVYIIAVDNFGYTHEVLAGCWLNDQMEAMLENVLDNEIIYDKDGNMLWQKYDNVSFNDIEKVAD